MQKMKATQHNLVSRDAIDFNTSIIDEREEDIAHICSEISEINETMEDIWNILKAQSPLVDSIESNIETSVIEVKKGNVQLRQARDNQSRCIVC